MPTCFFYWKQRAGQPPNTLVPEVCLDFSLLLTFFAWETAAREPRSGEQESWSSEEEKPLVTFDFHEGEDLTLGLGLVDILTNTQINMISPFDWNYRGDGGDICHCTSSGKCCLYISTSERIWLQNTSVPSIHVQDSPSVRHGLCFWQCLRRIFTSVLEERFPEIGRTS